MTSESARGTRHVAVVDGPDATRVAPPVPDPGTGQSAPSERPRPEGSQPRRERRTSPTGNRAVRIALLSVVGLLLAAFLYWRYGVTPFIAVIVVAAIWIGAVIAFRSKADKYANRPVPTMGWQALLYRLLRALRINYVPTKGLEELIAIETDRHYELGQRVDAEFAVFAPKGGVGKSTAVTNLAVLSAASSHEPTLVVDSRQKRGNIAERFGLTRRKDGEALTEVVPRSTITMRQAIQAHTKGMFDSAIATYRIIRSFPGCHLDVIASDATRSRGGRYRDFGVIAFQETMDHLSRMYRRVFYEADNELAHDLDLELMRRCTTPVFITRVNLPHAHTELEEALAVYRGINDGEFQDKIDRHGRLIVLATRRRHAAEQFAHMFGFKPEQVFLVPFDAYFETEDDEDGIHEDTPPDPIINLATMPLKAKLSYFRCLNSALESLLDDQNSTTTPTSGSAAGDSPEGT